MKEVTFKHEEQLLGEPSQISFQIILLPHQFTRLVTQSDLVFLQTADFLVGRVESIFQVNVLFFEFAD